MGERFKGQFEVEAEIRRLNSLPANQTCLRLLAEALGTPVETNPAGLASLELLDWACEEHPEALPVVILGGEADDLHELLHDQTYPVSAEAVREGQALVCPVEDEEGETLAISLERLSDQLNGQSPLEAAAILAENMQGRISEKYPGWGGTRGD